MSLQEKLEALKDEVLLKIEEVTDLSGVKVNSS